jgi:hypothetical protein
LRQSRRDWTKRTVLLPFEKSAPQGAPWEAHARRALAAAEAYFPLTHREPDLLEVLWSASREAVAAGCDDPLIQYFRVRWSGSFEKMSPAERNRLFLAAAWGLSESNYPEVRRAHALANAAVFLLSHPDSVPAGRAQARQLLATAAGLLPAILQDPHPEARAEALEVCTPLLHCSRALDGDRQVGYRKVDALLERANAPRVFRLLLRGKFYTEYAWDARGSAVAGMVPPEAWKPFEQRLREAERALEEAWELDRTSALAPTCMLSVALGLGYPRERMELWFRRALQADPDCYDACVAKLLYLEPKWYGSREDMLAFARECVRTKNAEGGLPLLLPYAHRVLALSPRAYYSASPAVWQDVRAGYEAYLAKHPDARAARTWYAKEAYWCGRYREAHQQFQRLGDRAWVYAFDNEAQYEHIRAACARVGGDAPR